MAETHKRMSEVTGRYMPNACPMCNLGGHPRPDIVQNGFGRVLAESGHFGELSARLTIALYSQCMLLEIEAVHTMRSMSGDCCLS